MKLRFLIALLPACIIALAARPSSAQTSRNETWDSVTLATSLGAVGVELLMPRIFYSSPEVTVGWKARWHVSVLAPSMTLAATALLNEVALKDAFKGNRPGCTDETFGTAGCETYGMLSTHTFASFAALGQGAAVFVFDTAKYSDGRFNVGGFIGHVGVPLILGTVTAIGRSAGDWETGGQVVASGAIGLGTGFLMGTLYALGQEPECGYTGSLICW